MAVDRHRLERALGVAATEDSRCKGRAMSHAEKASLRVRDLCSSIGEESETENTDSIIRLIEALSDT